ncbi:pyridoxal phosphate-dependent aminotransferase [Elusimicrobiota bacterium]
MFVTEKLAYNPCLYNIALSPIVAISEKAKKRAKEYEAKTGEEFIFFQRGDIDLAPLPGIIEEVEKSLRCGKTKYPASGGSDEAKTALVNKLALYNNIHAEKENIVVTYGGQEALGLAFELFRGKRAAVLSPVWSVLVENFLPYSNIRYEEVSLNEDNSIDYELLEDTLKHVDVFYVNNPQNPTGKVFTEEDLTKLGEMCVRHDVAIISDEAYEHIVFEGKKHISLASLPCVKNYSKIFTAFTLSKTFSMTGFRIGYVVTPDRIAANLMKNVQYTHTAGVVTFVQPAVKAAFSPGFENRIAQRIKEFEIRRDALYNGLKNIKGIRLNNADGAFYLFVDFSGLIPQELRGNQRSEYIFKTLLDNGICVVPGNCFTKQNWYHDYMRLSFSGTSVNIISKSIIRIKTIFKK